jgi:DnaJ-domain-containing protein 1
MSDQQRFPLQWPGNWPRTAANERRPATFRQSQERPAALVAAGAQKPRKAQIILSVAASVERLEYQLGQIGASQVVLSTNVEPTLSGRPRGNAADPIDVGAAVYFKLNGADRVLACDKWTRVADNIAALAAHIDAIRRIDRYGVGSLDQAFRGYTALQPATCEWWLVLGVERNAPIEKIEAAFTKLAKEHHPDRGGDANQMARLTEARRLAKEERKIA